MRRVFLLLAVVAICMAQTAAPPVISPPAISAFFRLAGQAVSPDEGKPASEWTQYKWMKILPPLTFTPGVNGGEPQLGVLLSSTTGMQAETGCGNAAGCVALGTATVLDIEPGVGVLCTPQVNSGVMSLQCNIDTAVVAYRVPPPNAAGPCINPIDKQPYGAGAFADDPAGGYSYRCVPGGPSVNGVAPSMVWSRIPQVTSW